MATQPTPPAVQLSLAAATLSVAVLIAIAACANANAPDLLPNQNCSTNCGSWATKAGMPTPRRNVGVAGDASVLYVAGGTASTSPGGSGSPAVQALDPSTSIWTLKAAMPDGRRFAAAVVAGGLLYVLGGAQEFPFAPTTTTRSYDPSSNSWTDRTAMPTARIGSLVTSGLPTGVSVAVVNGIVYVLGGDSPSVDAYNPSTNTWTSRAPIPTARSGMAVAGVNGLLYTVGGTSGGSTSAVVEVYDPSTNAWTTKAPFPSAAAGAAAVNGTIYVVATTGSSSRALYAYDAAANTWSIKAAPPDVSQDLAGVASSGGQLFLVFDDVLHLQSSLLAFTP